MILIFFSVGNRHKPRETASSCHSRVAKLPRCAIGHSALGRRGQTPDGMFNARGYGVSVQIEAAKLKRRELQDPRPTGRLRVGSIVFLPFREGRQGLRPWWIGARDGRTVANPLLNEGFQAFLPDALSG